MQTIEFVTEPVNGFFKIPEQYRNDIRGEVKIIIISDVSIKNNIVRQSDKAIAELKPVMNFGTPRPFGLCAGEFTVPDDFDAPLPESVIREFEG